MQSNRNKHRYGGPHDGSSGDRENYQPYNRHHNNINNRSMENGGDNNNNNNTSSDNSFQSNVSTVVSGGVVGMKEPLLSIPGASGGGPGGGRRPLDQVTCFKCGEKGHYANKCPKGYLAFLSPALSNLKRSEPDS